MANDPPFATVNHSAADLGIPKSHSIGGLVLPVFREKPRVFSKPCRRHRVRQKEKGRQRPALFYPSAPSPLTQALEQSVLLYGRKIYFFFFAFFAMVSSSYVLGTGGPTPSLADP